jgi:hypothetical protein
MTAGIVATLATDLWLGLLQTIVGVPAANWGLVGRWVAGIPRGVFIHRPITATPQVRGETAIGWVFHYVAGVAYAALYLAIMRLASDRDQPFSRRWSSRSSCSLRFGS